MGAAAGLFFSPDSAKETLNKRVRPSDHQVELLREKKDELEAYLKRDLRERTGFPISTYLQGSYKLHTLIRPLHKQEYDVDVGIYFEWGRSSVAPPTAEQLRAHLQASLAAFDDINASVARIEVPPKERCSRAYYEKQFHIDLPGYHYSTDTGMSRLATLTSGWEQSDPEKMVDWFRERLDGDERAQARRLTRYIKAWAALRFEHDRTSQPSSLMLSVLAVECYADVAEGPDLDDDDALSEVVERMFRRLSASRVVANPVGTDQDRDLNRLGVGEFRVFMDALEQVRDIAARATGCASQADAAAVWTEAFDYLIPLPDITGLVEEDTQRGLVVAAPLIRIDVSATQGGPAVRTYEGQVEVAWFNEWLRFHIMNRHDLPAGAAIRWVVRNEGEQAYVKNDLGHSRPDTGGRHDEHAEYHGRHFMDCEVRVNGRLHALTRVPVVVSTVPRPPRHPPRRPEYTKFRKR